MWQSTPPIMGHEMAGDIVKVEKAHQDKFKSGMKFTLQPTLNYKGTMWSPGYSYEFFGGNTTYCIIPAEVMELGCMLGYKGRAYYEASLAEPYSCSVGAFHAAYHIKMGVCTHEMGIREGGKLAIMAGVGPMGLGALSYALDCDRRPGMIVVTDVNQKRLDRALELFPLLFVFDRSQSACQGRPQSQIFNGSHRYWGSKIVFLVPLLLILPRFFGLDGAMYAQPVTDLLSFLLAVVFLIDEFRKMPKEDIVES